MLIFTRFIFTACVVACILAFLANAAFLIATHIFGGLGIFARQRGWLVLFGTGWLISFLIAWQLAGRFHIFPFGASRSEQSSAVQESK